MVRKTKWIENSDSDEEVDEVARRALAGRLDFVWHYLSRAVADDHQPEDIHQARVATRRAMAALQIFNTLLPPRRARKMKKQLKRIRRVAGQARDLDVLAARLQEEPSSHAAAGAKLEQFIARLRQSAQPAIERLHAHLSAKRRFARRRRALVDRVRLRPTEESGQPHTFAEAARQGLKPLVDQLFAAAAVDFTQAGTLHTLRICGKRVRYAIEIFVGAFGPEMRQEIYPLVVEIQEKLGKIIDHATAADLYSAWLTQVDDSAVAELLRSLIAAEHQKVGEGRHEFLAWWTADRVTDLRRRFDEQFAAYPQGQSV